MGYGTRGPGVWFPALLLLLLLPGPVHGGGGQEPAQTEATRQMAWGAGQEASSAPAGPRVPHPEAVRAINGLRSPYCPGLMLEVCPSEPAKILRDSIQDLAEAGMTSAELVEWMLGNHGEEYRAVPLTRGTGLWAWLAPPLALLLGVILVVVALVRLRRSQGTLEPAEEERELTQDEAGRVREALRELEAEEEPIF